MRLLALLTGLSIGIASTVSYGDGTWTPIAACGPKAPGVNDIMNNSPLWQCAKAEFAKSGKTYEEAVYAYRVRMPSSEQWRLTQQTGKWDADDEASCSKPDSLDLGCAIAASYRRADLLKSALAKCGSGPCHIEQLQ